MNNRFLSILILLFVIVLSFTVVADWMTNPDNREYEISKIDEKIDTVMGLTAGSTLTSAAISMLPDDQCTPIANELAQMAKYFLVVLSALYFEKYMITVSGYAAFKILIPIACGLFIFAMFNKNWKDRANSLAIKLVILAISLAAIVPISVKVSDLIYENYKESIDEVINEATEIELQTKDEGSAINRLTAWIAEKAITVRDYVAGQLSKFVEALAIMLVTACLIPILIIVFFVWLLKILFGIEMQPKIMVVSEKKEQLGE